jgi:Uma2 family endonuclease
MAERAEKRMTVEEFLDWYDGTDTRHMLVDGAIVAMTPPTQRHSRIAAKTVKAIERRLAPLCSALVEAGLALSIDTCVQADVAMTCEPPGENRLMEAPVLIVEILSPSTRRDDLGLKIESYEEMPSVREIWAIDSERRWVRVWRRAADESWTKTLPIRVGSFQSDVLGDEITLDELYATSGL